MSVWSNLTASFQRKVKLKSYSHLTIKMDRLTVLKHCNPLVRRRHTGTAIVAYLGSYYMKYVILHNKLKYSEDVLVVVPYGLQFGYGCTRRSSPITRKTPLNYWEIFRQCVTVTPKRGIY